MQLSVANALFRTHFVEAGNVADTATLLRIAGECGMDVELAASTLGNERALTQTRVEAAHLAESGVRGVPFFLFGGKLPMSGAQPVPALMQAMRQFA